ncbi:MAG: chloride channel protein [Myxococcota bacterium]|jgi:CIC family chloride channel protein|nr:chloride channel protein [Myxococcota bacterium]
MLKIIRQIQRVTTDPAFRHAGKWFVLAGLVGIVGGMGAVLFQFLSQELFETALGLWAGYVPRAPGGESHGVSALPGGLKPWLLVVLPTLGGLLSGFLVFRFAPEAEGHGTDGALDAYHQKRGVIPWRVPVVKTIASVLTLGLGGSGGREGPIAQIGAGFGSFIAQKFDLSAKDRRILLAAGMGAGVGAIFRAPLAGALFASEIHYKDPEFESEAVIPSAISSIVAYCFYSVFYGFHPLFTTPDFKFSNPLELLGYTFLALVMCVAAYVFIRIFYGIRDYFTRLRLPMYLRPALGGLLTGTLGLLLYLVVGEQEVLSVLAFGYGTLQGALDGQVAISLLVLVAFGKMLTTGLTIGSGGSGGVFGPSMVIGGALGGAVGLFLQMFFPDLVPFPGAYALVGMAGFFAGAANTPVSTIIMVSEMSGSYHLLLPALWVTTICYALMKKVGLYEAQIENRSQSPAHRGEFRHDVLEDMKVSDVFRGRPFMSFGLGEGLGDILHKIGDTHQSYFPILNAQQELYGIFSLNDIRAHMYDEDIWNLAVADDFATTKVLTVRLSDGLDTAISRFASRNIDELPVLAKGDSKALIGLLRRKDVIDAYYRRLWEMQNEESTQVSHLDELMLPR